MLDGAPGVGADPVHDSRPGEGPAGHGDADSALGPGEPARLPSIEGLEPHTDELRGELTRVSLDSIALLGQYGRTEDQGEDAREGRSRVRVRGADHEPLARQSHGLFQ